jgi:hypothetical protein
MTQIIPSNIKLCFVSAFILFLFSCSSETTINEPEEKVNTEVKAEATEDNKTSDKTEDTKTSVETEINRPPYEQASDGLEFAVINYYKEEYKKGELRSVVNGIPIKMKPEKDKVYIETKLVEYNSLGFFSGKYPDFLNPPEKAITTPDANLLKNLRVNSDAFWDVKGLSFLRNRNLYNSADLLLVVSKAFYFQGAYYVHAWRISNDPTMFHYRRCTFKFNKDKEIVDSSCANYYQMSYRASAEFLKKSLNTKVDVSRTLD